MTDKDSKAAIKSVNNLLAMDLTIPNYQRPYKWTRKNVAELLDDIEVAISDSRRPNYDKFTYRVGSVILHNNKGKYDIVDGQQRLITLSLIKHALETQYTNSLFKHIFTDSDSIKNIFDNNCFIQEWIYTHSKQIEDYKNAFNNLLEIVVLVVDEISEAFQLFDSQNTRGKELNPHDLLKAYHLREMSDYPFEKLKLIKHWEDIPPSRIRELFSLYLFPILQWSQKEISYTFTVQDIDIYKGVDVQSAYTYAQRTRKAMPCFQINEPFCAGSDFFKMVEHYIDLLEALKNEISQNFKEVQKIINANKKKKKKQHHCSIQFHRFPVRIKLILLLVTVLLRQISYARRNGCKKTVCLGNDDSCGYGLSRHEHYQQLCDRQSRQNIYKSHTDVFQDSCRTK